MCKVMEDYRDEMCARTQLEERRNTVLFLLKTMEPEDIANGLGYPLEFVKQIAAEPQSTS